jgi:hypothetical protein
MARWLPAIGIDAYLYAPKADVYLRRNWKQDWPDAQRAALATLARRCEQTGLKMGVGLSPFALFRAYGGEERRRLRDKVAQIDDLGVTILALLFDDMPGNVEGLARKQAEICSDVADWSSADHVLVCPTYYSDDPVLDRVFGERPRRYLQDLGAALPHSVEVFWTGPAVCAESISTGDLAAVIDALHQPLALWDNYPVNDSKTRSEHLYMQALAGRAPHIRELLASHWCNAMNQAALSLPALASLAAFYGRETPGRTSVFEEAGLSDTIIRACASLATQGRDSLTAAARAELRSRATGATRAALELADWLDGGYLFDPACLTD